MFTMKFETDNFAFEEDLLPECAETLREIANQIDFGATDGIIRDMNGNTIGKWKIGPDA
jgi:hypothetical protein